MSRRVARPTPPPERLTYHEGARLLTRDLRDLVSYERRLLGLHVAALHDTWGVALGLGLAASGQQALVAPGVAYTGHGEAIALGETALDVPALPPGQARATFDLVLRAAPEPDGRACERLPVCTGEISPARAAQVRWVAAVPSAGAPPLLSESVRLGEEVPLGRFERVGATVAGPDYSTRRAARPLTRPHVAFGRVRLGDADWKVGLYDVHADIDTSAGGFGGRPHYFASVASARTLDPRVIGPFLSISDATATRFALRIVFAKPPTPAQLILSAVYRWLDETTVAWVGVEPTLGCSPALGLTALTLKLSVLAQLGGAGGDT